MKQVECHRRSSGLDPLMQVLLSPPSPIGSVQEVAGAQGRGQIGKEEEKLDPLHPRPFIPKVEQKDEGEVEPAG